MNAIDNYAWAARGHIIPALGRKRLVKLTPADVAELQRAKSGEVLGLTWSDVDLKGRWLQVNRSLKHERGELRLGAPKTKRSRRALVLPRPVLNALRAHRRRQVQERIAAGHEWQDLDLVFPTSVGTLIDPSNFRRHLSGVTQRAGLGHWHPHELRHRAASLLSAAGLRLEEIADVLGHSSTRMTGDVYRHAVLPGCPPACALWSSCSTPNEGANIPPESTRYGLKSG